MKHIKRLIHMFLDYIPSGPLMKIVLAFLCRKAAAAVCICAGFSVLAQQHTAQTRHIWRSNGPFSNIKKVAVDPHNSNIVYAGGTTGIFKSITNGTNWFSV